VRLYIIVALTAFCLLSQAHSIFAQDQGTTGTAAAAAAEEKQQKEKKEKEEKAKGEQQYNVEPVVVTATRTEVPLSEATKDINVVTNKDMQTLQQVSIPEVLDTVPGVQLQNQGGPGQYSNLNIRGAGSQYVQFQYNGFPLRDAIDTQTSFQYLENDLFGQSGINRIEILNGTNSVLYGSSAIGGVINIIPQKWQTGFTGGLMTEMGPHATFVENGGVAYGQDNYFINLNPTYITTNGLSNGGPNSYWYNNFSFNGGAGIKFGNNMSLEVCNLISTSDMALSSITPSLNAQHQLITNQASATDHVEGLFNLTGLALKQQVSPTWDYSVKYAFGSTERQYYQPDFNGGAPGSSNFDGNTNYLEMQHNIHATDWLTLTGGVDFDEASYANRLPVVNNFVWNGSYTTTNVDWFGCDLFGLAQTAFFDKSLLINAGLRFNDHQNFQSKVVEEASAAYIFKQTGTKIHTAFGTGYRTPSLYEIYGGYVNPANGQTVTIGNPNLRPEESTSYDIGITQPLFDNKLNIDVTGFHMDFDHIIVYDGFANQYVNGDVGKTTGIEAKIQAKPCKYFSIGASYTYAFAQYKPNNTSDWTRVNYWPMDTLAFIGTVYPMDRLSVSVKVLWEGNRIIPLYDPSFNEVYWREPSDVRVDMITTYKILKNYRCLSDIDLFFKITNLTDTNYTEAGYQMPGRWFWGGVKMAF
jgi:vitamin B12 transporter